VDNDPFGFFVLFNEAVNGILNGTCQHDGLIIPETVEAFKCTLVAETEGTAQKTVSCPLRFKGSYANDDFLFPYPCQTPGNAANLG
jgi:hypothetical protein